MTGDIALVESLLRNREGHCIEFKRAYGDPSGIGKYISALANASALHSYEKAYLVWGIDDATRTVVGTDFDPASETYQQEPLEFWLARRLEPSIIFTFRVVDHPDGRVVLLEIPSPVTSPVEFNRTAYIRIGSATPRLADYPEYQRRIWVNVQSLTWERLLALEGATGDDVLRMLDYPRYFDLTGQSLPDNRAGVFDRLEQEGLIRAVGDGTWSITNLAAILFAKVLGEFGNGIARKAIRLTVYDGPGGYSPVTKRYEINQGYASGLEAVRSALESLLPTNEQIGAVTRTTHPIYPGIAIRELIANALIHQDFTVTGAGPSIRLFSNRMEIENPGEPLIELNRFIDHPPRSRNEILAALMRRMNLCEEEGSGIDKALDAIELHQLPPPDFQRYEEPSATRVCLFAPLSFVDMTSGDRIRACYQHACLRWLARDPMRNASLRDRFGLDESYRPQMSRIIRDTQNAGLIVSADPDHPRAGYKPFWG